MARLPDSSRMASNDRVPVKGGLECQNFHLNQKKPIPIPLRSLGITPQQPSTRRNSDERHLKNHHHRCPPAGHRTYQRQRITRMEQTAPRPQLSGVPRKKTGRPPCSIPFSCPNHHHSGCITRFDEIKNRGGRKQTPAQGLDSIRLFVYRSI